MPDPPHTHTPKGGSGPLVLVLPALRPAGVCTLPGVPCLSRSLPAGRPWPLALSGLLVHLLPRLASNPFPEDITRAPCHPKQPLQTAKVSVGVFPFSFLHLTPARRLSSTYSLSHPPPDTQERARTLAPAP